MERVEVPYSYELPDVLKALQKFLESVEQHGFDEGNRSGYIQGKREGFEAGYKKACELYDIQITGEVKFKEALK